MCADTQAVSSDKEIAARHPGNLDIPSCFGAVLDVFSLVRRRQKSFMEMSPPATGGSTVHEALETVNLCLPFITFFPLFSVFKFQFQISSVLSFISFRDGIIYTSSLNSFSSDAALGYLFTSWRASLALLKGSAMTHQSPHFDEIKANVFFFLLSLQNNPLPSLIQCPQTHLILSNTRSKGALSPCWHHKSGLLWKVWRPCLNNLIPHLCQGEMVFPKCEICRKRGSSQCFMFCYCPLLHGV